MSFHFFVTRNIFFHPFPLNLRVSLKLNESLFCLFVFYPSNRSVHFVGEFNLFIFRVIIDMWRPALVCHFTDITLCYKFFLFFVIFTFIKEMHGHKFKIKHYYKVHTHTKIFKVPAPFLPLPIPLSRTATYR